MKTPQGWIGIDLDGTLAHDVPGELFHPHVIGEPVLPMLERVKGAVAKGLTLKIFTARVSTPDPVEREYVILAIREWLNKHGLPLLDVTCVKDYRCVEFWDDRAVAVERNTGKVLGGGRGYL